MSVRRFYIPEITQARGIFVLSEDQSKHMRGVLRLGVSDKVRAFNGLGNEYECEVVEISRKRTAVECLAEVEPSSPESNLGFTLGIPMIKQANAELILQKAVELGVTRAVPFVSARCDSKSKKLNRARWEKIVIESSKQCGRATLMKLDDVCDFEELLERAAGYKILFSEGTGASLAETIDDNILTAITGPEGGWEESEILLAEENGFAVVHFGGRILRAETASIAVMGLLQHKFGDMN